MSEPDEAQLELRLQRLEKGQKLLRAALTRSWWHAVDRLDRLTLPSSELACPICGRVGRREDLERLVATCSFGGGELERYRCAGCGCIFGPRKVLELDRELLDLDYGILYADYAEGDCTDNEIRAFRALAPQHGLRYLNWGCGAWSRSIPLLRTEGYDVWGYDPCPGPEPRPFVVQSRTVISPGLHGLFSNNVIEHLLRPVEEFRYFHGLLAPGGMMAHATPCYEYAYAESRFHVVFLTGDSPFVLAERSGFRVAERVADGEFRLCLFERR